MEASISSERKALLLMAIHSFCTLKKCTKRKLLSLISKLSFACKVVPAGRIFLRLLIDLSCSVSKLHHHIRMTSEARQDLIWWSNFLPSWSGTSMILDSKWTLSSAMQLFTDTSGSKGWGGILVKPLAPIRMVPWASKARYSVERAVRYGFFSKHMGSPLGQT